MRASLYWINWTEHKRTSRRQTIYGFCKQMCKNKEVLGYKYTTQGSRNKCTFYGCHMICA